METNLHPITKEYSIVLVPMEAEKIFLMIEWGKDEGTKKSNDTLEVNLKYELPHELGLNEIFIGTNAAAKLIGPLSSISEEKAREIIESIEDYGEKHYADTFLEDINDIISSLGIKKEGFKEIIIKH